jgi:hypothetical protein
MRGRELAYVQRRSRHSEKAPSCIKQRGRRSESDLKGTSCIKQRGRRSESDLKGTSCIKMSVMWVTSEGQRKGRRGDEGQSCVKLGLSKCAVERPSESILPRQSIWILQKSTAHTRKGYTWYTK